jgi:predicted KAP-like P-loop ATPase
VFSVLTGIPHPEQVNDAVALLKGLGAAAGKEMTLENLKKAVSEAEEILKPAEEKKIPEQMRAFHKEFAELLEIAGISKLVVLIDDLDRCLPNTAIETLEAIRLFLFVPKTAFIIAADEAMIEYSVKQHFPDLPATSGPMTYARYYLEKLIQVPFRIPSLGYTETQTYVSLILAQAFLGEDDERFPETFTARS